MQDNRDELDVFGSQFDTPQGDRFDFEKIALFAMGQAFKAATGSHPTQAQFASLGNSVMDQLIEMGIDPDNLDAAPLWAQHLWFSSWNAASQAPPYDSEFSNVLTKAVEVLEKIEYSSDGFIKRYPDESEVNSALENAKRFLQN